MMATQKKKPLPGQPRKIAPLTRKAQAAAPPHPQLEVLQERMDHLATREQVDATTVQMHKLHGETMERMGQMATKAELNATNAQMNKLHGETMERINQVAATVDVLQERMGQMATKAEMYKLHGETIGRIEATRTEMHKLHGDAMERIGRIESDMKFTKWVGSTLGVAIVAGLTKIIFFPVM